MLWVLRVGHARVLLPLRVLLVLVLTLISTNLEPYLGRLRQI